jgi:RNA polymerase sigma factor (TIGR02999 family)
MSDATGMPGASAGRLPAEALLPLVYDALRDLAARRLAREAPGQTLDATALVHEAYLRVIGDEPGRPWDGRGHFFAAAATAMRRILIENARRKGALRHGGRWSRERLEGLTLAATAPADPGDLLDLDAALSALAAEDPEAARLVELRYFAGLTLPEAAEALGISPRSADRLWSYARATLYRALAGG